MNYDGLKIPNHMAMIMDGNGRWATNKKKIRSAGHLEGSKSLKKIAKYGFSKGVKVISVYAFSTENFKRSVDEVNFLMKLFINLFTKEAKEFENNNIKVIFSGKEEPLPKKVLLAMKDIEKRTYNCSGGTLNICLNYGGHDEIIDTTKKIAKLVKAGELDIKDIDNELFRKNLYQDLPEIDFLIRTSGEQRVSNFMLWQLSYSEMYFPKVHWPDFDENEFDNAILAYNGRERRFGGALK